MHRSLLSICTLTSVMFLAPLSSLAADSRATDVAAIRNADMAWSESAKLKSVDVWVANYTDDAVLLFPNQPAAVGIEAIRKPIAGLLGLPGVEVTWGPVQIEVSSAGDMGYLHGTYQLSFDGPNGSRIKDHGKYVEVWKKQPDGRWKCVLDMFNTSVAPAQ